MDSGPVRQSLFDAKKQILPSIVCSNTGASQLTSTIL